MSVYQRKHLSILDYQLLTGALLFMKMQQITRLLQGLRFDLFPSEAVCHPPGPDRVALSAELIN